MPIAVRMGGQMLGVHRRVAELRVRTNRKIGAEMVLSCNRK